MCKTTTAIFSSNERTRRVFPPCRAEASVKTVTITVYDPQKFIESRADLKNALLKVEQFYNGLKSLPGLPSELVTDLSAFTFQAVYKPNKPGDAEREALGRMDFPFYLFNYTGLMQSSASDVQDIMEAHKIPMDISVRIINDDPDVVVTSRINPEAYKGIENDWASETILGFGFPGSYYDARNPGNICRKIGLIKIDAVLKNIPPGDTAEDRFAGVLAHELGHMFSLAHVAGTLMNDHYEKQFRQLNPAQIDIIRDTLKILSP